MQDINWKTAENRRLVEAILSLKNPDEAERFLRDLLTKPEIEEFTRRLKAAEMLSESVPYSTIESQTGLSSTTIARISKWLNEGMGGYKQVIAKLHHHRSFRKEIGAV